MSKTIQIRAENMLTKSLSNARLEPNEKYFTEPACTWISKIVEHFLKKDKLREVILDNLKKVDFDYHNFIAAYLLDSLPVIFETESQIGQCARGISHSILSGNEYVKNQLIASIDANSAIVREIWIDNFVKNLKSLTDLENPEIRLADGTGFLGKFRPLPNPALIKEEDDIPF